MSKPNNENALASEAGGGARAAEGSSAAPTTQVNGGAANDKPVVRIEGLRKSFGDNVVLRGSISAAAKWSLSSGHRGRASPHSYAA